jgi:glycosyltransferase involved in cell wall biosynthesis
MQLCVVSFKECWQDASGTWWSSGGFPFQMAAIASLFDETTLLICSGRACAGGSPLPSRAKVVPMRLPVGATLRRKLDVIAHLPYYWRTMVRACQRADAVHVPPPGDLALIGMLVALAMRKRLLVRYCGSWVKTTVANRATRWLMRRFAGGRNVMLATGDGATPPARGMSWIFATALSRAELEQIHPRLDRGLASPPRLIYAGRLASVKGVADLVRAVSQLAHDGFAPIPVLTLAGDGPQRAELEALVTNLDCTRIVQFVGQLDRYELLRRLLESDVCVLPSLSESFCKARLDALLCGVPVMTTEVGFGRRIVGMDGERGWLVPPGDVQALAAALRNVLRQSIDWPALRTRCRAYVESRTLDAWARAIGEQCAQQWRVGFVNGRLIA